MMCASSSSENTCTLLAKIPVFFFQVARVSLGDERVAASWGGLLDAKLAADLRLKRNQASVKLSKDPKLYQGYHTHGIIAAEKPFAALAGIQRAITNSNLWKYSAKKLEGIIPPSKETVDMFNNRLPLGAIKIVHHTTWKDYEKYVESQRQSTFMGMIDDDLVKFEELSADEKSRDAPPTGSKNDSITVRSKIDSDLISFIDDYCLFGYFIICSENDEFIPPVLQEFCYKKIHGSFVKYPYNGHTPPLAEYVPDNSQVNSVNFYDLFIKLHQDIENMASSELARSANRRLVNDVLTHNKKVALLSASEFATQIAGSVKLQSLLHRKGDQSTERYTYLSERYLIPPHMTDKACVAMISSILKGRSAGQVSYSLPPKQTMLDFISAVLPGMTVSQFMVIIDHFMRYCSYKTLLITPKDGNPSLIEKANRLATVNENLRTLGLGSNFIALEVDQTALSQFLQENSSSQALDLLEERDKIFMQMCNRGIFPISPLTFSVKYTYCYLFYLVQLKMQYCFPFGKTHPNSAWVYASCLLLDAKNDLKLRAERDTTIFKLGGYKLVDEYMTMKSDPTSKLARLYESSISKPDNLSDFSDCMLQIGELLNSLRHSCRSISHMKTRNEEILVKIDQNSVAVKSIVVSSKNIKDPLFQKVYSGYVSIKESFENLQSAKEHILESYGIEKPDGSITLKHLLAPFEPTFVYYANMVNQMATQMKFSAPEPFKRWFRSEVSTAISTLGGRMFALLELFDDPASGPITCEIFRGEGRAHDIKEFLFSIRSSLQSGKIKATEAMDTSLVKSNDSLQAVLMRYELAQGMHGDLRKHLNRLKILKSSDTMESTDSLKKRAAAADIAATPEMSKAKSSCLKYVIGINEYDQAMVRQLLTECEADKNDIEGLCLIAATICKEAGVSNNEYERRCVKSRNITTAPKLIGVILKHFLDTAKAHRLRGRTDVKAVKRLVEAALSDPSKALSAYSLKNVKSAAALPKLTGGGGDVKISGTTEYIADFTNEMETEEI